MVSAEGNDFNSAAEAISDAYASDTTDEFVLPAVLGGYGGMNDGDGVLMANFRADRAREILAALCDPDFDGFVRSKTIAFAAQLGMVEYSNAHAAYMDAIFPPSTLSNILGEVVANAGLKQLRIAETEKYAHVTFFLNGGREAVFEGEDRILVPSPKFATYDLQPEMSAPEVSDNLVLSHFIRDVRPDHRQLCEWRHGGAYGRTGSRTQSGCNHRSIVGCIGAGR